MKKTRSILLRFSLLALFSIILSNSGNSQLTPDFNADTTEGCEPVVIKFNDLSTGDPTSWLWDLGNGIISTQKNPVTFYFDPGNYTVSLTIISGTDTQTIIKKDYITVHSLPDIKFQLSDSIGCFPFNVGFTDLSIPTSGDIQNLQWDFGDGTFSNNGIAAHTYNVAGNFTISLKVTNTFGCTQLISKPNQVTVLEGVTAGFNFNDALTCNAPANFQFNNISKGKNINTFQWDFGDGTFDTTSNPLHTFSKPGSYSVGLTVSNTDGCSDKILKSNVVQIGSVTASFTSPDSICQKAPVNFVNTSQPVPASVQWNFGDGSTSTALQPNKVFANPGTYKITLTSFFSGCNDVATRNIIVLPLPDAGFTTSNLLSTCKFPLTVTFKSNDTTFAAYQWNFGNGSTADSANPTYTYATPGLYNVSLSVTSNNGCTNRVIKDNLVYFGPPSVLRINGLPYRGCAPFETKLSALIDSPEPVVAYLWNFGDTTTSTEVAPLHKWSKAGNYSISVTITTVNGCTTTFSLPNGLILTDKPKVAFAATPQNACAFKNINFTDSTLGTVTRLLWFFGDGGSSTEKAPVYNYKDTGSFDVTLIASNEACYDTLKIPGFIYINPPIARFNTLLDCAIPSLRQFKDSSLSAASWQWNFDDGTTSTEQNPQHTFPGSGLYNVNLEVSNGTCRHSMVHPVWVIVESPVLIVTNASKCKSAVTRFIVDSINTNLYNQYQWAFGDGNSSVTKASLTSYHYVGSGTFNPLVTLIDNNGCKQSVGSGIGINIIGPRADFSTQLNACLNAFVNINNLSEAPAEFPISTFIWNYGDGTIDTLASGDAKHSYVMPGKYDIKLTVIDSVGCTDAVLKPAIVMITQPKASFTISDSLNCRLSDVKFASTSTGLGLQYLWNLGDGTVGDQQQATHQFKNENEFNIKLVVKDTFGCIDSLTKTKAVKVANVKAVMQTKDSLSSCPPFIMTLRNKSTNYSSFYWDFNDGSFSNLDSPSHYYNVPGIYKIKLITKGYGACADTATTTITLRGPSGKFRYDPYTICSPGLATFIASASRKASFIWDFGDGTITRTTDSVTTHAYVNTGRYKPKLLLVDVAGCQVPILGKDTIIISKAKAAIKSINTLFCDSTTVQFYDSSRVILDQVTGYEWNFGDGGRDTLNRNPVHIYKAPGKYPVTLKIKTKNGCTNTDSMQTAIRVIKSPEIKIVSDSGVCQDKSILFKGEEIVKDTSALKWSWSFANGESFAGQYPTARVYSKAGTYMVTSTAINTSGCRAKIEKPVEVYATPTINAGSDSIICLGNKIFLNPTGGNTYQWTNQPSLSCFNCTSPIASPVNVTTYKVEGTSIFGCKNSDSLRVMVVHPFDLKTSLTDTLCVGESAKLFATGSDIYNWSPASGLSNSSAASPVAQPVATTNYRVISTDKYLCFADTGYVKIVVYPIPKLSIAQANYTLPVGNSVLLKTTSSADITSYRWTPSIGLSCTNCPQPNASPRNTTTYRAQVFNGGGCTSMENVTVTVICNNANIFIPNTFSPNGDGMNDVFFVRGKGIAAVKAITIFNRWGLVVFQKTNININDQQAGWDGRYNSATLSPDVFVYKVDVVCENNQVFSLQGNVTLIR
ncbi:MAG: PKD domain-containing protein [Chitinophagaceae bacterium]|nr:PKD domain-containing protein [Chitinophagaceae bacterium]